MDGLLLSLFHQYQLLQQSKLFDAAFCLKQNPDVGYAPSADFDVPYYREQCQEAARYA